MQDDSKTKSTDFLPGKPSMDSMSRASSVATATASSNSDSAKTPENASAHVIDLKNAPTSFADSPLLNEETKSKPTTKPPKGAPVVNEITIKDNKEEMDTPTPNKLVDESVTRTPTADIQPKEGDDAEKGLDDINLSDSPITNEEKHADQPKKGGKLKWVFIILGVVVVLAIAAGAVYYITMTTGNPF